MTNSLKKDANYVTVAGGVYDDGSNTISPVPINSITGRVKVSATISGGTAIGIGKWYMVTGAINSVNTTFTIPVTPNGDFLLVIGYQPQMLSTDYTVSGNTITYAVAPDKSLSSQPHMAYISNGYGGVPTVSSGSGAPASTPTNIGNIYVDTLNIKVYIATGTTNNANWTIVN